MTEYLMPVSPDVRALLDDTVEAMTEYFGISRGEAVARINAKWHGFSLLDGEEMLTHEDSRFWAMEIYYGAVPHWSPNSSWPPVPPPEDPRFWTSGP